MGMFDHLKQAKEAMQQARDGMQARTEMKRIEAEVRKLTAEYSNGGITVVAKGDLSIERIAITPEAYEEVKAGKPARFETMLLNVINGSLKKLRDQQQQLMMKQMQSVGGLGGLFGK